MTILFGFATLVAFVVAIGLPIGVSLVVWVVQWLRIRRFIYKTNDETGEPRDLPRPLIQILFDGQYYPFMLMQPLHWALPWVLTLLFFGLPAGVLIDNGFVVGWWTLGVAVALCVVLILYVMRFADEYTLRNPPWWLQTPAVMTMVMLALLCGVAADTWLI